MYIQRESTPYGMSRHPAWPPHPSGLAQTPGDIDAYLEHTPQSTGLLALPSPSVPAE